jgi:hypothetical protein
VIYWQSPQLHAFSYAPHTLSPQRAQTTLSAAPICSQVDGLTTEMGLSPGQHFSITLPAPAPSPRQVWLPASPSEEHPMSSVASSNARIQP